MFEVKTLTSEQVGTLADIIYNYDYKFEYKLRGNVYFTGSMINCYNPRNAILLLDKDHNVFEFIEVCFECDKYRESSDRVSLRTDCNQKPGLIKNFFKGVGIEYGVIKGVMTDK